MQQAASFSSIPFRGTAFASMVPDIDTRSAPLSLRFGLVAGAQSTGASNVFVGAFAGRYASPEGMVALGCYCGEAASGDRLVLIGTEAGRMSSGSDSVVLGSYAGSVLAGAESVVVGAGAVGTAVFAQGGLVALGARAGASASTELGATGGCDTLVGFRCAEGAQDLRGSNVLLGACAAQVSVGMHASVVIGYGAAAEASNLSSSVVIGVGAALHAGGDGNVVVGADAAPITLATGGCNVVIGHFSDTVSAATSDSIAVGRASAAADRSVSVGTSVVTNRFCSTSIGSDIASTSDNAVAIGGQLSVNAVSVFADTLTAYARPVYSAVGVSNAVHDLALRDAYAVLAPRLLQRERRQHDGFVP